MKITRTEAIKALSSLFEKAFGSDKGSGEAYEEWCESNGLCPEWDGESVVKDEDMPPSEFEIMLALGLNPQEIIDTLHINPLCIPNDMCIAYGVKPLKKGG